jgi:hypothetical protein
LKVPAWIGSLEAAQEWKIPPWEVTGEELNRWRRYVWKQRRDFYTSELSSKMRRERESLEIKRLQNGR